MALIDAYPLLRSSHLTLVTASGALFALRGAALLAGAAWPSRPAARIASVLIDTALLTVGVLLAVALGLSPHRTPWLATKLALLVVYVVLGTFALKRARTRGGRALAYAAAVAVFLTMVSIARAHDPLGWLARLVG